MSFIKLKNTEDLTCTLRAKTNLCLDAPQSESAYWELREFMANLPPLNVYKYPKALNDAWHKARAACREYEAGLRRAHDTAEEAGES